MTAPHAPAEGPGTIAHAAVSSRAKVKGRVEPTARAATLKAANETAAAASPANSAPQLHPNVAAAQTPRAK